MNKALKIIIVVLVIIFIGGLILFLLGLFQPKKAELIINSTPTAAVYLNGEAAGKTPFQATQNAGEVTVRLVPEAGDKPLATYETRVTLSPKIQTIIVREFGESEETSQGETISFERVGGKEASLAIVSIPDSAEVSIDGRLMGFAPYKTGAFAPGDHQITLKAPNYIERVISVKTVVGYKLTVVVKLAPGPESNLVTPTPTPTDIKVTMVEILETPTGFLNVRAEPSAGAEALGQAKPGEKYRYLETDEATGWYKIEYVPQAGASVKEGWVSNQYAKIVEEAPL